jgi:hypothetical protein
VRAVRYHLLLGRAGLRSSTLLLGAMTFGEANQRLEA